MEAIKAKWRAFLAKTGPFRRGVAKVARVIGRVVATIARACYTLRGVFIAVPVGLAAVYLARRNMEILPDTVGINLLASGEYQFVVEKNVAIMGPLAVTAACLLLVFLSRKTLYPWLISVFSLVLPLLIWVTNVFPA